MGELRGASDKFILLVAWRVCAGSRVPIVLLTFPTRGISLLSRSHPEAPHKSTRLTFRPYKRQRYGIKLIRTYTSEYLVSCISCISCISC